jgi:hypothetical protein
MCLPRGRAGRLGLLERRDRHNQSETFLAESALRVCGICARDGGEKDLPQRTQRPERRIRRENLRETARLCADPDCEVTRFVDLPPGPT